MKYRTFIKQLSFPSLKKILMWGGILILLLIVSVWAFLATYDFNRLKPHMTQAVRHATGRELVLEGALDIAWGFSPALTIQNATYQNAPWGTRPEMVKIRRLEIQLAVLPLFFGNIKFKRIALIEPDILIETDSTGATNLPMESQAGGRSATPAVWVKELRIINGRVAYVQAATQKRYDLTLDSFSAVSRQRDHTVALDLTGRYREKRLSIQGTFGRPDIFSNPSANLPVDVKGRFAETGFRIQGALKDVAHLGGIDLTVIAEAPSVADTLAHAADIRVPDVGAFQLKSRLQGSAGQLTLRVEDFKAGSKETLGLSLTGTVRNLLTFSGINADISIKGGDLADLNGMFDMSLPLTGPYFLQCRVTGTGDGRFEFKDLTFTSSNSVLNGSLIAAFKDRPYSVDLSLKTRPFDLAGLLDSKTVLPVWAERLLAIQPAALNATLSGFDKRVRLKKLDYQAGNPDDVRLALSGRIDDLIQFTGVDLAINIAGKDTAYWKDLFPHSLPARIDYAVEGRIQKQKPDVYRVGGFKARAGGDALSGKAEFDFSGKKPFVRADLDVKRIDIRHYIKADHRKNNRPAGPDRDGTGPLLSSRLWTLGFLNQYNVRIGLRARSVLFHGWTVTGGAVNIALKNGKLRLAPFRLGFKGGSMEGRIDIVQAKGSTDIRAAIKAASIPLEHVADGLGLGRKITGNLDATVDLNGRGRSWATWMAGLNGTITAYLKDGRIHNSYIDVWGTDIGTSLLRLVNPFHKRSDLTEFNCFINYLKLDRGMARSEALLFDTDQTAVYGSGTIDLKKETINIYLKPSPKRGITIRGLGRLSASLAELAKPFKISGTLARPTIGIDTVQTLTTIGKGVGGFLLFGPLGIAAVLADVSTDDDNPCRTVTRIIEQDQQAGKKQTPGKN